MVIGLVIQQVGGSNLFLHPRMYIKPLLLVQISQEFIEKISVIRKKDASRSTPRAIQPNFRSGSIKILDQYLVSYTLISSNGAVSGSGNTSTNIGNEMYILAITHIEDNPFSAFSTITRAKKVLFTICKGPEVTSLKLGKAWAETYFALERVLQGDDGTDILSQKLADMTPYTYPMTHGSVPLPTSSFNKQPLGNEGSTQAERNWKLINSQFDTKIQRITQISKVEFELPSSCFTFDANEDVTQFNSSFLKSGSLKSSPSVSQSFVDDPIAALFGNKPVNIHTSATSHLKEEDEDKHRSSSAPPSLSVNGPVTQHSSPEKEPPVSAEDILKLF